MGIKIVTNKPFENIDTWKNVYRWQKAIIQILNDGIEPAYPENKPNLKWKICQ